MSEDEVSKHRKRATWLKWTSRAAILLGLGVLGFAAVRYWQDSFVTEESQRQLAAEFEQRVELVEAGLPLAALAGDPAPEDSGPQETIDVTDEGDDPRMVLPTGVYTPAEIDALQPEEPSVPGILQEFAPDEGEVMGRITIPALELDWMLVEGVDLEHLKSGPGHMPWTPLPGQPGNSVISGHRTTNGAPFFDLDLLTSGDLIMVETLTGTHTYRTAILTIVEPTGVWVTQPWEGAWLTLTTCNPKYSAAERLIVFAELVKGPNAEAIAATSKNVPPVVPDPS